MRSEQEIRERVNAYERLCEQEMMLYDNDDSHPLGIYSAARRAVVFLKWTLGEMELYTL